MKALLLFVATAAANSGTHPRTIFEQWTRTYGRNYSTVAEYESRFENFQINLQQIELLNRRHAGAPDGARFGVNKYADLSRAEQRRLRGFKVHPSIAQSLPPRVASPNVPLQLDVDWRMRNVVAPIQDQGQCGSCWAFSTTSNIESVIAIANKSNVVTKLSEQQLVDCDHTCGTYRGEMGCDGGCDGGLQPNAFTWVTANGQTSESDYPYQGVDGSCKANQRTAGKVNGYVMVSENETEMAQWVQANGPLSVALDASEWTFYFGGIMRYLCWGKYTYADLDHAVNIVGFGGSGSDSYWIIRNSWGTDWVRVGDDADDA